MPCEACADEARQGAAVDPFDTPFPVDEYPDRAAFERPEWLQPGQGLTVTDDGRVAGYFYQAGSCLVHDHGACPRPSPTGYAAFHQQQVTCADGEPVRVGVIGMVGGHADPYASIDVATAHYANPAAQRILCRAGDDEHGGWIAGVLVPRLTFGDVAEVRRCALSGDWRPMPQSWWKQNRVGRRAVMDCEGYDCIGPTFVNRPGLPLVEVFEAEGRAAAMLGGIGGVQLADDETEDEMPVRPEAKVAAPPPPPAKAPPSDAGPPEAEEGGDLADLQNRVAALEDMMGQCVDWINQQQGQMAAAVLAKVMPLPEMTDEQWLAQKPRTAAQWDTAYVNDLPDSAFAYIEPGGTKDADGRTTPRSKRHFPIRDASGSYDAAHVRAALSRAPQSPFGDRAMAKIAAAAKSLGIGEPAAA